MERIVLNKSSDKKKDVSPHIENIGQQINYL